MPPKRNSRTLQSQSARPSTGRTGAPLNGSPPSATTPAGASGSHQLFAGILPASPSGGMAAQTGPSLSPPTAELVGALTSALRAAFSEINPPRRTHFTQVGQPLAGPTDDDEEELLFTDFPSQDPPGRYRTRIPDNDSDDPSDSEYDTSPERDCVRHPRHVRPQHVPTITRGQRLFTTSDPPTRRDFSNALVFVDRASRQSRFFSTRDVVELQILENFLAVWDSIPPLRPSIKLQIFDRVRLLYHVAETLRLVNRPPRLRRSVGLLPFGSPTPTSTSRRSYKRPPKSITWKRMWCFADNPRC